jgi:hypothetical protein
MFSAVQNIHHAVYHISFILPLQILMSARREKLVSVLNATAEIHGVAMTALAAVTFYTSESMTHA